MSQHSEEASEGILIALARTWVVVWAVCVVLALPFTKSEYPVLDSILGVSLVGWYVCAALVLAHSLLRRNRLPVFFWLAVGLVVILGVRAVAFLDDPTADLRVLSYTIGFATTATITSKGNGWCYVRGSNYVGTIVETAGATAIIIALLMALGLGPISIDTGFAYGEQRFTILYDVATPIFTVWFWYRGTRAEKVSELTIYGVIGTLGMARILSTASRGLLVGVVAASVLLVVSGLGQQRRSRVYRLATAIGVGVPIFVMLYTMVWEMRSEKLFVERLSGYWDVMMMRDLSTGYLRIKEALYDWSSFVRSPILGVGVEEAGGYYVRGRQSAGHFVVTGILARFGAVGLVGFAAVYASYIRWLKVRSRWIEDSGYLLGFGILCVVYLVLGNPLLLLIVWPLIPLFVQRESPLYARAT